MIFTDRTITVRKGESRIDEPIVVYRGDYELEVRFTILNSRFKFMSGTNMIESEKASYGQLAILTPYGGNIFSDIVRCNDGSVTFVLTAEMLNQIEEVGLYSFQIRLMDYNKESRVSIPPIEFGIEVREPIASEDHDNSVNNAIVGYSIAKVVDPKEEKVGDTFDGSGNYNKTKWETGDRISEGKLNKIEDAINIINQNEKNNLDTMNKRIDNNFNVLSSEIEFKRDRNEKINRYDLDISTDDKKIKLGNLSEEVLNAMSGDASVSPVLPDNYLTTEKYADGSVTLEKISGYIPSKNLFDDSNVIRGCYVSWIDGTLRENPNYVYSDFIKIKPNTSYARNVIDQVAFYDEQHIFIEGYGNGHGNIITSPPNACYIRVSMAYEYTEYFQLEEGDRVTGYTKYSPQIRGLSIEQSKINITRDNFKENNMIPTSALECSRPSKNLFNKNTAIIGKYVRANEGVLANNADYFASDYIEVNPDTTYCRSMPEQMAFYTESKTYISGLGNDKPASFVTPSNCKYIIICAEIKYLDTFQVELGGMSTSYEEYGYELVLTRDNFKENNMIPTSALECSRPSKNLFNKNTAIIGKYVRANYGVLANNADYFASDYIEVNPDTTYCRSMPEQMAFYTESKTYISGLGNDKPASFVTPSNCKYIIICAEIKYLDTFQVELGGMSTSYEEYGYKLVFDLPNNPSSTPIYTLNDAWIHWKNNEKFPVGFLGDSTTDGVGTSGWNSDTNGHAVQDSRNGGWGCVDYINQNAYPYKLEQLIKEETKTTNPRIYNIGYSGTHLNWTIPKLTNLFGGVYSDVKMVGLVHGINDRTLQSTAKGYSDEFTMNLETVVQFLLNKDIQPFMVTTQSVVEPGTNNPSSYPLRTSEDINSIANECKIKIANKYNLEVLDMNTFGDLVLTYSNYDLQTLCKDKLHFGDVGHSLEAGYLFSKICPRAIIVDDSYNDIILSFTSQKIRTDVSSDYITFCDPSTNGFKTKAQFTKNNSSDQVVQDFWIMNTSKGRYNLNVYTPSVNGVSYVRLNGVTTVVSSTEQLVGELEIGLHHVQFLSGKTNSVSCYGFKMKPVD